MTYEPVCPLGKTTQQCMIVPQMTGSATVHWGTVGSYDVTHSEITVMSLVFMLRREVELADDLSLSF